MSLYLGNEILKLNIIQFKFHLVEIKMILLDDS